MAIIPCLRRIIERIVVPSSRGTDSSIVAHPGGMFHKPAVGSSTSPKTRVRSTVCCCVLDCSLMPLCTDTTADRFANLHRSRREAAASHVLAAGFIGRDFGTLRARFAPVELGRVRFQYQGCWYRARP